MSDTPRTDKASHYVVKVGEVVQALFSRQLERELNAAKASHAADVAELNERLTKQQSNMLDTIVGLRAELTRWQSLAGLLAAPLDFIVTKTDAGKICFHNLYDSTAEMAYKAIAAYESATSATARHD